jgi:hypothetical protein
MKHPWWIVIGALMGSLIGWYMPGSAARHEPTCLERPWLDTRPPC